MSFTTQEIENMAVAALDFHIKNKIQKQTIQNKPLLKAMKAKQKTFPGGKGNIVGVVKGNYNSYFSGYTHDDQVGYQTPANLKEWSFPWKETHGGITITMTELKKDGISVVDTDGKKTSTHSKAELTRIVSLLEDKLEDFAEGMERDQNGYCWGDGTDDVKAPAGVKAMLTDTPNAGTTGGIDRAANTWWRHRARLGSLDETANTGPALNTSSGDGATLPLFLKSEMRQLTRYGGKPDLVLAGSDFIEALEAQLYAKGSFSDSGFSTSGKTDIGIADIRWKGIKVEYDPTLDDLGESKRMYVIDTRRLHMRVMEGEDMKKHNPSRPYDRYAIYRGVTWTGNTVVSQLNCHGVYAIV